MNDSNNDELEIYDRLNRIRLVVQQLTSAAFIMKEGIERCDATAELSAKCIGILYMMLDYCTHELKDSLQDLEKIMKINQEEDFNNEV